MTTAAFSRTTFYNIRVDFSYDSAGAPAITYTPAQLTVDQEKSVICYQLASAPAGIAFATGDVAPLDDQFGIGKLAADARMLTFDDLDLLGRTATYDITITFSTANGPFKDDPQIINRPG